MELCTLEQARLELSKKGAEISAKFLRRICSKLPYSRPCGGAKRIYRYIEIEDVFNKSFKTPQKRSQDFINQHRSKNPNGASK